ncbi:MAG TPA: HNH endonuclease signature motif containing protein, partial [Ilumatobacteraceae bacterium]|nr:HNH endonuclease signature motif containing protein [Ilumatobacteraceae bacterium]
READTNPAKFGVSTYSVPRSLFRKIAARDGGCRFPGCNRPVRFTDAHHIHHWQHGGPTEYHNLLLLCSRHHHYVHQQRLIVKLEPNGTAHFTWHHGQHRHTKPRGAPPTRPAQPSSSG